MTPSRPKRSRWDTTTTTTTTEPPTKQAKLTLNNDKLNRAQALKAKIAAQLTALKASNASKVTSSSSTRNHVVSSSMKKARVLELDFEKPDLNDIRTVKANQSSVVMLSDAADTATNMNMNMNEPNRSNYSKNHHVNKKNQEKGKFNPYLTSYKNSDDDDEDNNEVLLDNRIEKMEKIRRAHRPIHFVPQGVFIEKGERKRAKEEAAAKAGFVSGRKEGTYVKSIGIASVSTSDGVAAADTSAGPIPLPAEFTMKNHPIPHIVEWWDMELLPIKMRKQIAEYEKSVIVAKSKSAMLSVGRNNDSVKINGEDKKLLDIRSECDQKASLLHCKSHKFVQHPVPVKPAYAATEKPRVATLHLTKRELKRQRKLRRAEKQRDLQDQQALGLIPAAEPRLTMANFMQVLGDQAVLDPSKIEAVVAEKIAARRLKHDQINLENKLSPKERSEKKWQKFAQEDTSKGLSCALLYVKDMSHAYHRAKVDLNAQQMSISGGVVEVSNHLSVVIAEGGARAIKKFVRLMTVRIKWKGLDSGGDDGDISSDDEEIQSNGDNEERQAKQKFNSNNSCSLLWQGINPKRLFKGFQFQNCVDSLAARKVLEVKGLANFWDQAEQFAKDDDAN